MKRAICAALAVLAAVTVAWGMGRENPQGDLAAAAISGEMLRLHVLANSDSEADQALKLVVRDAVLSAARPLLQQAQNEGTAREIAQTHTKELRAAALTAARKAGYKGDIAVSVGRYGFPDRTYEGVFVPAGDYDAVRVVIGKGGGHNWWCVMYPTLCLPVNEDAPAPKEVKFRSGIAHWWRSITAAKTDESQKTRAD